MKKIKLLHCKDFKPIIEEAIKQLKNGESRLAVSNYPLNYACLSEFSAPDFSERLSSDYSLPSSNKNIEDDYFEEIKLIEKLMVKANVPIKLADWQKGTSTESGEKMYKSLNRRAFVIQIWDWYAIPWRYKNDAIYLICSPQDVMGTPIVHSYPVNYFLINLANKFENQIENQNKTWRQLGFWKKFGIILSIIIVIFLLVKFL